MTETLRVLLIEDEATDAELVLRELKRAGLQCVGMRVDTEDAFRARLADFRPHVILSDFSMPRFDGMSALAIAHQAHPEIPFIFVSGTLGEEYAIRALKSGADDYVLKDNLVRLPPTVERAMAEARAESDKRRMEAALRHSEQRFRLAASTGDVWDWTIATGEIYLSHQWKRRLGYEDHELASTSAAWLELLHPDDRPAVLAAFSAHVRHQTPYDIEFRMRARNGDYHWSHAKGLAMWDEHGRATYMAGTILDVTERKQAEIKVRRLNRVYAVLSGINALIVRVRNRDELFREACRVAKEAGQFRLAWIGLVEPLRERIRPVAWQGAERDYLLRMPLGLTTASLDYGFAGQAVTLKRPTVVQNMLQDSRVSLREEARAQGFQSLAILPLIVTGDVVGTLALYSSEPGFFDEEELKLLQELAGDIAFALDHIDKAEKLNYLAYYDSLTGLANRALFFERLTQYLEVAERERHKMAVLAVDLDRFQKVNDTLGRQAGDELLKQLAQRFVRNARDSGRDARIEADHFAIVVPEFRSEEELARGIELRYQECFGQPFRIGDAELRMSARIGVALYPNDGSDAETLFRHAEAASRKARASGDRFLFYAQDMSDKIAGALALENKLRLALEREEFVLHYQPKVDARTRRILGVEALIRWQSPELGMVSPLRFIPLMEETGMIIDVGAWAMRQAVRDHQAWSALTTDVPRIAVNVSAIQLRRSDFIDTVRAAIALGSNPPGIDLELTETLVMEDIESNIAKLRCARDLGLGLAIDDFGTGYSSLRYLAKLPVQTLKIDRSFISTMLTEADTMTLVSTVISLAHSLRLEVVAEGVETEEQAAVLRREQCDQMQGYLFSRPVPMAQLQRLHALRGGTE